MQAPLEDLRLRRVTFIATLDEQRAHLLFEELAAPRRRASPRRSRGAGSDPRATEAGSIAPLPLSDSITAMTPGRRCIMFGFGCWQGDSRSDRAGRGLPRRQTSKSPGGSPISAFTKSPRLSRRTVGSSVCRAESVGHVIRYRLANLPWITTDTGQKAVRRIGSSTSSSVGRGHDGERTQISTIQGRDITSEGHFRRCPAMGATPSDPGHQVGR